MVKAGVQAVTVNSEGLAYQQREFIANLASPVVYRYPFGPERLWKLAR